MRIGENDYEHKNQSYLSSCIDIADSAMNSYVTAIEQVETTYLTADISAVYFKQKELIPEKTLTTLITSDAFLTKEGCKEFESECISYITEIKNKAVSLIVGKLNSSFIIQNSVDRAVYGQTEDGTKLEYIQDIVSEEPVDSEYENEYEYDFESGEFTMGAMLDLLSESNPMDFWKMKYNSDISCFCEGVNSNDITDFIKTGSKALLFNSKLDDDNSGNFKKNYCITVPDRSYDFKKNKSIPLAEIIKFILKAQIYQCITLICNKYISKMTSIPIRTTS